MEFRLLGPLEGVTHAGPVGFGAPQQRLVLAVLLLEPERLVPAARLVDILWPDRPPRTARNALQVYVSRLRAVLRRATGDAVRIETLGTGYRIPVEPTTVDLHRFYRMVSEARRVRSPAEAAALLRDALALRRGEPLEDLENPWLRHHVRGPFEEVWIDAQEELFEAELECGNHRAILADLRRLSLQHPTRERLAGLLMRTLCQIGSRADALAYYRDLSRAFSTQLGIDPGGRLAALHRAILRDEPGAVTSVRVKHPFSGHPEDCRDITADA